MCVWWWLVVVFIRSLPHNLKSQSQNQESRHKNLLFTGSITDYLPFEKGYHILLDYDRYQYATV